MEQKSHHNRAICLMFETTGKCEEKTYKCWSWRKQNDKAQKGREQALEEESERFLEYQDSALFCSFLFLHVNDKTTTAQVNR